MDTRLPESAGIDRTGLEARYRVEKINDPTGKHDYCRYFVLDPQHDPLAREALLEYSRLAVEAGHIGLAADLRLWLRDLREHHTRPDETTDALDAGPSNPVE